MELGNFNVIIESKDSLNCVVYLALIGSYYVVLDGVSLDYANFISDSVRKWGNSHIR